ncbi:helix-turn-helix domain-containing protein [Maribacter confluentis]|uniref:Helix-turn-helix domain-containing protein n=1 Tax=Maribacter confluentis TaxID=1656093 RepID=A0ABT8RTZ4_9FLAO|nr:helix-turn-helix domain-containing protein [Maribacter confluentis]MDO1514353.1 helix-turn-helix domain-containing protein [Maribacter confluentis]
MKKKNIKLLAEQIVYLLKNNSNLKKEEDLFLKIEEASKLIHLSKYTIYGLVHKNSIPYHKRGRRLYFLKSEILDWLKAGKREDKTSIQNEVDEYLLKNQF